jgi:peptidase M28-like protein
VNARTLLYCLPLATLATASPARAQQAATVVPQPETKLPLKHAPERTSATITAKDLMTRLYIFADDSMQGREAGTLGNFRGTDYIAREAARIGLHPAGDEGTFFQTLPFKTRSVNPASSFIAAGAPFAFGTEWAATGNSSAKIAETPVVFGGIAGDTVSTISAEAAQGKIVVYNTAGTGLRLNRSAMRGAATAGAVVIIVPEAFVAFFRRPSQFVDDAAAAGRPATPPTVFIGRAAAAKLFDSPLDQLTPGATGKPASLDLQMQIEPVPYATRNVVAILPGSDPKLAGQYVAIGAHNDHVGFNNRPVDHDSIRIYNHIVRPGGAEDSQKQATPEQQTEINAQLAAWRTAHPGTARLDSIFNGADDDGSGSVTVLEIAEKLAAMKTKPKRSILFVWHVGEEKGLLGSAFYTDHPTVARDSIVAQLNMDMVGRGNAWDVTGLSKEGAVLRGDPNYVQLVGSRRLSTELGDLVEATNTAGKFGFKFDYAMDANGHAMNIYCRSDHYEYARYGIPVTFFTTGGHSDYHQVTDEPEYIDYDHMARIGNLVESIALRVANLDHRVVVDHEKPDPRGGCRQ